MTTSVRPLPPCPSGFGRKESVARPGGRVVSRAGYVVLVASVVAMTGRPAWRVFATDAAHCVAL